MEEVEKTREERLKAWVAALSSTGPIAAPVSPPPKPVAKGDIARTQLFPSWELWTQFLTSPPAIPALSQVLSAVVRIANLVDVKAPVNAPDIVAAIARAEENRLLQPRARESIITLKILAVTDTLQHLFSCVPTEVAGNKELDMNAIASFIRANAGRISRTSSEARDLSIERVDSEQTSQFPQLFAQVPLEKSALPTLPVNFSHVLSLGHSEPSELSLGDDGGIYGYANNRPFGDTWSNGGSSHNRTSQTRIVQQSWSQQALNAPTPVKRAAGCLYCPKPVDELWQIGDGIGAGNFSNVHHATSRVDGTKAAIKIISKGAPDLFTDKNVCREVAAFCHLGKHESVVNCLQVFEDDRFVYIVMELLTGGQLLPRVADASHYGQYSESDARDIARNIARGLAHCHALGIAHRDVKPENILFSSESNHTDVRLTDFGIAHILQCGEEGDLEMVGTPLYVAPEVLLQMPYGCAADMWSLGVIVHILLTGFPPFDDDSVVVLINKVKSGVLEFDAKEWEDVTPMAKDFVIRLLCRNPRNRLTAAQAILHPWLQASRTEPRLSEIAASDSSKHTEFPSRQASLQSVQTNLKTFVKRRDSRPQIGSSHKLSLLVSLSERKLKGAPSDSSHRISLESIANGRDPIVFTRQSGSARAPGMARSYNIRMQGSSSKLTLPRGGDVRNLSSPKRKATRKLSAIDQRMLVMNHSEFRPSYAPVDDVDTEKLHEMVDLSAVAGDFSSASPKSVPVPSFTEAEYIPPRIELAELGDKPASVSATTATPSASAASSERRSSSNGHAAAPSAFEKDAMDQSNVLMVRLDESLKSRREADAILDSPARTRHGFLRGGNRKSKRRTNSASTTKMFLRRMDSKTGKKSLE